MIDRSRLLSSEWVTVLRITSGFGLFLFLFLPTGVPVMNDDFGYLASTIETIRRFRPWTDDWLEPWSASLSVFSAAAYKLTGSFLAATQGLQAALAAIGATFAYLLFHARGFSIKQGAFAAIALLSFPSLLWKLTEYTSMVVYIPCLLGAIWAADKRRWDLFFICWLVAVSSRQSAVVWLFIPLTAGLRAWLKHPDERPAWLKPAAVSLGSALVFVLLAKSMNHTQAQAMITDHLLERASLSASLRNGTTGACILALSVGVGALLFHSRSTGPDTSRWSQPGRTVMVLGLAACIYTFLTPSLQLYFEHASFRGWFGQLYLNLLIGAGLAGLCAGRFSVRWELLSCSVAALGLVCLRTDVWDYYYTDIALFSLFAVIRPRHATGADSAEFQSSDSLMNRTFLIVSLGCHLLFAFELKCRLDRDYAGSVVAEEALHRGELDVLDIGAMSYGFIGWQLHRHFVAHDGKNDPDIGGFMRYLQQPAAESRLSRMRFWADSKSLAPIQGEDETRVIGSKVFRVGWFWHQRYTLLKPAIVPTSGPALNFNRADYHPRRLPLTDDEWRRFIEP